LLTPLLPFNLPGNQSAAAPLAGCQVGRCHRTRYIKQIAQGLEPLIWRARGIDRNLFANARVKWLAVDWQHGDSS
jgi:hypothetical protein